MATICPLGNGKSLLKCLLLPLNLLSTEEKQWSLKIIKQITQSPAKNKLPSLSLGFDKPFVIWTLPAAHSSSPALLSRVQLTQPHTPSLPGLKALVVSFPGTPPSHLQATKLAIEGTSSGPLPGRTSLPPPSPWRENSLLVCLLHYRTSHYAVSFSSNFSPPETIFSCSVFFYFCLLVCLSPTTRM